MMGAEAVNTPSPEDRIGVPASGDDCYVAALMARGGLARVELVNGVRRLVGPDGGPWRGGAA